MMKPYIISRFFGKTSQLNSILQTYNGKKIMHFCLPNYRISNGLTNVAILPRPSGITYTRVTSGYILTSYAVRARIL